VVRIIESRPLSRLKKWRLGEVLRRAAQVTVEPDSVGDVTSAPAAGQEQR